MQTFYTRLLALAVLTFLVTACSRGAPPSESREQSQLYVVAVNYPLYYFAERLAGDAIEVRLPAPPDTDPALWRPTVEDILLLQGAERVLLNGAGYSPWRDKVALSDRKQVVTSSPDTWIALENQVTHSHGPRGEHAHGDYAFTTWMDFSIADQQAQAVAQALSSLLPEEAPRIAANLQALQAALADLDARMQHCGQSLSARQLIYSHPVYDYFERRYQLPGTSLHWEPDRMPEESEWAALEASRSESALFIWEAEPDTAIAERMAAMALPFVVLDPAANRREEDWLAVQRANLARLEHHCAGRQSAK